MTLCYLPYNVMFQRCLNHFSRNTWNTLSSRQSIQKIGNISWRNIFMTRQKRTFNYLVVHTSRTQDGVGWGTCQKEVNGNVGCWMQSHFHDWIDSIGIVLIRFAVGEFFCLSKSDKDGVYNTAQQYLTQAPLSLSLSLRLQQKVKKFLENDSRCSLKIILDFVLLMKQSGVL